MIPDFDAAGNLPAGEHPATWQEMLDRYGYTPWRRRLLDGLLDALRLLYAAGSGRAWIDGSFVTAKEEPRDSTPVGMREEWTSTWWTIGC